MASLNSFVKEFSSASNKRRIQYFALMEEEIGMLKRTSARSTIFFYLASDSSGEPFASQLSFIPSFVWIADGIQICIALPFYDRGLKFCER